MIDTSVVIPVFKEEEYLRPVLHELLKQTCMFRCEIILSEYNPDNSQFTRQLIREFKQMSHVPIRLVEVQERGIPLARHEGIMAARGEIICDFDADAVWNRIDALEMMIEPIVEGRAVMTNCDNMIDLTDVPEEHKKSPFLSMVKPTVSFFNALQRHTNWSFGDPGTCFFKYVYEECGGFDLEHEGWETGAHLTPKIFFRYPGMVKNVQDVMVIQSPRRTLKQLKAHGKYEIAVRKGKLIDLEAFYAEFKDL